MLPAAERRGGLLAWGLSDRSGDGAVVLDPGRFAEEALRECSGALSKVLALADRDRLSGGTRGDVSLWVTERRHRASAAALFGLSRGGLRQERVTFA